MLNERRTSYTADRRPLINAARHTRVNIDDLGDRRLITVWRRSDSPMREGEMRHLHECASQQR
jgi:hypothetical protein